MFSARRLIYGFLASLLLAVVACGGSSDEAVPASATSDRSVIGNVGEQAAMAHAAAAVRSFRAMLTVELPGGAVEGGTIEFVVPDRSHFAITFSGGTMTNEMIIIGNDRYAKRGEAWFKIPAQGGLPRVLTSTGGLNQLEAFRAAAETGALIKGGSDTVNSKQCQIYSHTLGAERFEYCVAENLPLRMKVAQGTTANITFLFTEYNQVIDISEPR